MLVEILVDAIDFNKEILIIPPVIHLNVVNMDDMTNTPAADDVVADDATPVVAPTEEATTDAPAEEATEAPTETPAATEEAAA